MVNNLALPRKGQMVNCPTTEYSIPQSSGTAYQNHCVMSSPQLDRLNKKTDNNQMGQDMAAGVAAQGESLLGFSRVNMELACNLTILLP